MKIYIPTRGRARLRTVERLGQNLLNKYGAVIVSSRENAEMFDLAQHRDSAPLLLSPPKVDGIAPTRQFILDHAAKNGVDVVLMLDDDLPTWCQREPDPVPATGEDAKYHKADLKEIERGLADFAKIMKSYAHGSIGHRLFCQRHPELYYNSRMLRALAYNVPMVRQAGAKFRLKVMEDFDMQLQLMTQGFENVVYNRLVQDQYGNNVEGGCAAYRTAEVQAAAAHELARLWPDFVTVTTRAPKREWGGMGAERTDVKLNWRRAVQAGRTRGLLAKAGVKGGRRAS